MTQRLRIPFLTLFLGMAVASVGLSAEPVALDPEIVRKAEALSGELQKTLSAATALECRGEVADGVNRTVRTGTLPARTKRIPVSVVSKEYAQELFAQLARRADIPYRVPDDGCYARAHAMAQQLDQAGVTSVKAFIEDQNGHLTVSTPNHPSGFVEWWYHVAPAVLVKETPKSTGTLYVFDPSIFDRPVPLKEWVEIQSKDKRSRPKVYYRSRFIYQAVGKYSDPKTYRSGDIVDQAATLKTYLEVQAFRDWKGQKKEVPAW